MKVILKDEPDIDSNDQNSILEHLDKVVCIGSSNLQFLLVVADVFVVTRCCLFRATLLY